VVDETEALSRQGRRVVVRRTIPAPPSAVFAAWTEPTHLLRWFGPRGVTLAEAEVDLRPGGRYRLANRYADGSTLWISGVFEAIDPPRRLIYTWAHEPVDDATEHTRVTVTFEDRDGRTEVTVVHEGFESDDSRVTHEIGWHECLDRLAEWRSTPE
jgi:uncharacterized protein YndB with AHSA1/START domain